MPDYKKMYFTLFNCLCDAAEEMRKQNFGKATEIIQTAQLQAEALYIEDEEEEDIQQCEPV